ncbi:hypothetical protein [Flavobacterium sp. JP2137]|uniref:hypothetical protein n=1 Tax=Flavobacterium sp. JP2137 TaxID=3414510 RepID=UPI003D30158C
MAEFKIVVSNNNVPPEQLGEVHINILVGQTKIITSADLMRSNPPYFQLHLLPLGDIKINEFGASNDSIVRPSDTPIIAQLENNGTIIRSAVQWQNNIVLRTTIEADGFRVKGNSIGDDWVGFIANAYNSNGNVTSDYSAEQGKIWIHVVSNVNTPPSRVGNNSVYCNVQNSITLTGAMFTSQTTPTYQDLQGDPAKEVRIDSLPSLGYLRFNGRAVTVGQIITMEDLNLGKLKFYTDIMNVGQQAIFNFSVSDTGTGQFTS